MTKFGTQTVNRAGALKLAVHNIGRLQNTPDGGLIGFTKRELKRRDVVPLIGKQEFQEVCTMGAPFWFQARIWFSIGRAITKAEERKFWWKHRAAWEAKYGSEDQE